jgi:hypothetical protein
MACLLYVDDEETNRKINIDDLYERRKMRDQKQLSIFNKILNRVHRRITHIGRNKANDKHIWFTVPEYLFGEPLYNKGDCIGYLVSKLEDNGFNVRYVHPSNIFISWNHWIPSYVRSEFKKKTGMMIDEKGNVISKKEEENEDTNAKLFNDKSGNTTTKEDKKYTPIGQYRPTGNLVYNQEMFEKLEKKVNFS